MTRETWEYVTATEATRRQSRRNGTQPLMCRVFGHSWMGPWVFSNNRPWCRRCGHRD